jgi:SPP1 family predicted phage head-tail adaptor
MQSGKLRKRFTIQTYTDAFNDYGETTAQSDDTKWSTFAMRWGSLNAVSGKEYEIGDKVNSKVTHEIVLRYLSGLLPKMRFKLGTRYFNIDRILPDRTDKRNMRVAVIEKVG